MIWVRFPGPTWLLITISMGSPALFWPPWAGTHTVHRHMCRKNNHIFKKLIFLLRQKELSAGEVCQGHAGSFSLGTGFHTV